MRNKHAEELYGKQFLLCSAEQQEQIAEEIPQRISEIYEVERSNLGEGGAE